MSYRHCWKKWKAATSLLFLFISLSSYSQEVDSSLTEIERQFSPRTASLLSMALPGAGQIYNKKYWKAPIVWAGLATSLYFVYENSYQYKVNKLRYISLLNTDPSHYSTPGEYEALKQFYPESMEYYRRWRDISYIATAAIYILNILDANVDAHLKAFDVSDDLSLQIQPTIIPMQGQQTPGLTLAFNFK